VRSYKRRLAAFLELAGEVAAQEPRALVDLARLVGRPIQAAAMVRVLSIRGDSGVQAVEPDTLFFDTTTPVTPDGRSLNDLTGRGAVDREIDLARDLVFPWPWCRERLRSSLANIGPGRPWGPWSEDLTNHRIVLWLPIGVAWVGGGNHSITVGIVHGEGRLTPTEVWDISTVYDHVRCDGRAFVRVHDGQRLAPVTSWEAAGLFEIGRLMVEHSVFAF
jgi:hypothetical protein